MPTLGWSPGWRKRSIDRRRIEFIVTPNSGSKDFILGSTATTSGPITLAEDHPQNLLGEISSNPEKLRDRLID
jgi:hypothetical protein